MEDVDKTKKQLINELVALRQQNAELKALHIERARMDEPNSNGYTANPLKFRVSGINLAWDLTEGTCTFEDLPVIMLWLDTTLMGFMAGLQTMVGPERFILALQGEGRNSVGADWQVISRFPTFHEGFAAIANIAAVAGWGNWQIISMDTEQKHARFRVYNSWEGAFQKTMGVSWGSGMLAGKLAGYCSRLFGTNCWAEQTAFIARGDDYDEFVVQPSDRTVETEIEALLATDQATRADLAVALQKLKKEIAERQRAEETLQANSVRLEYALRDLRETQEQLIRQEKLAVLGQLAGGVGHELRNPLGVISNAVYFLQIVLTEADETVKEYLELIAGRLHEAEKIISDLLNLSRTRPAEREPTAISKLATEVLRRHPPPEEITVTADLSTGLPLLFVDPQQIVQVLTNLVINAYQAMPEGGELTLEAQEGQGQLYLFVADTGTGMSSEAMEKLFEPLYSTKAKGVGLGLTVSKNLVEVNEGNIAVESREGHGSIFTVTLPVAKDA